MSLEIDWFQSSKDISFDFELAEYAILHTFKML